MINSNLKSFNISSEATEEILRSMQEGLIVCNSEDIIQSANDAALKLFGCNHENSIVGNSVATLFHSKDSAFSFLKNLEKEKQIRDAEISFVKQKEKILCSVSASIILDVENGDQLKAIVLHDITARKKTEEKLAEYAGRLEKINKELDQFAYIVSHDLKAPLRAIINLSQWLQEDLEPVITEDSRKNLEMLKNRTFRMEALITGILEYSKIGRSKVQPELVDVDDLISEVLDSLSPPSHFTVHVGNMPSLITQRIMMYQVFSNLLSNAIKYNNKENGIVNIECHEDDTDFIFSVQDNGPGIDKEFYDKIFVIFQTLQSRDKVEGTGIGLTIVKRIIEEQGGKVWVESEVGVGTKFLFRLPKSTASQIIL
jgi:PAS domain S-box-containing protein